MNNLKKTIILTGGKNFLSDFLKGELIKEFDLLFLPYCSITKLAKNKELREKFINESLSKNIFAVVLIQEFLNKYNFFYSSISKRDIYFLNVEVSKIFAEISISLNIEKFIYISTADIYGLGKLDQKLGFNTFSPLIPNDYNSASKLATEYSLQSVFAEKRERLTILRVSEILDNRSNGHLKFISLFAKNSLPFPVLYIGRNKLPIRSFTNMIHLNKIIYDLLKNGKFEGEIINISTYDYTILSLLNYFNCKNFPVKIIKIKINYFLARMFLKIPIIKKILFPFLLNHKVESSYRNLS